MTEDEFWDYLDCSKPDDCWVWDRGKTNNAGRHSVSIPPVRSPQLVYRVAWSLTRNGGLPPARGIHIHHLCENKNCCNPRHLLALTVKQHKAIHRPATCPEGHDLGRMAKRLNRGKFIQRACKECCRIRQKNFRDSLRATDGCPWCGFKGDASDLWWSKQGVMRFLCTEHQDRARTARRIYNSAAVGI